MGKIQLGDAAVSGDLKFLLLLQGTDYKNASANC